MSVNGHQHGVSRAFRGGRSLIIVFALFALLASAVSGLLVAPTHASTEVAYCSEELNFIWLLNDYRASNGKEPLLLSDTLSLAADRHSSDMGKYSFFSHRTGYNTDMTAALSGVRSDWFVKGSYPWDRMRASGYDYSTSMGENIAAGQQTAQKLFDDFKASKQGHNETMLSSYYKVVGVSQVYVPGSQSGWYWTVDFGGYVDPSVQPAGVYQVSQRVQQNNPKLFYAGTWSGAYSSSASGGSFRYANSARAAVNVTFKGTSLAWLAKKGSNYGKAWVKLDDRAPVVVDLYSSYAKYKQRVYQTGLLADAEHTLTIYWLGQKNAASKGYILSVDAFDLVGELTQAPAPPPLPTTYQNTDQRITYLGSWGTLTSRYASGGNLRYSSAKGSAAIVQFNGTAVELLAKKAPNYGKALICLDGVWQPEPVDFYSASTLYGQSVFSRAGLCAGAHTLIIKCLGEKNPASGWFVVDLDAVRITGTLTQASKPDRLQETRPPLLYTEGAWQPSNQSAASYGTLKWTNFPAARVTVAFKGTYLAWIAKTGPQYGKAKVSLDGSDWFYVDLYSPSARFKQAVYNTGYLEQGFHTLVIEWAGLKNPRATGTLIDVDAFDVLGTLEMTY